MSGGNFAGLSGLPGINEDTYPEDPNKGKRKKKEWEAASALATLAANALASSNSLKELGKNAAQAGFDFLSQATANAIGGPLGTLLGGGVSFLGNLLMNQEKPLNVKDGAIDVRVINWQDDTRDLAAVRDASQLAFRGKRRQFSLSYAVEAAQ